MIGIQGSYCDLKILPKLLQVKYKVNDGEYAVATNLKQLALSWRDDCSKENAGKLWTVLYGQFETHPYWHADVEREVMEHFGYKYTQSDGEDDSEWSQLSGGCVGFLATQAKTEICKTANRLGKKEHGQCIGISNARGEGSKTKRRKPGVFDSSFVKATGTGSSDDPITFDADGKVCGRVYFCASMLNIDSLSCCFYSAGKLGQQF